MQKGFLGWLNRAEQEHGWGPDYGISGSSAQSTIMATCFAIFAYELSGELNRLPEHRLTSWREYLWPKQDEATGLFKDPRLDPLALTSSGHDVSYLHHQTTFFALSALDALDSIPNYPLGFVEPYRSEAQLIKWLEGLNWSDPWLESNRIMFIVSFLTHMAEKWGDERANHSLRAIFDWLDAHQEPQTGFWGVEKGATLLNAMAGAFHLIFLYLYLGREFQHVDRIIDSTLSLQQTDGLFHPSGGGEACLDLDAADILVKCSLLTDYRAEDVRLALGSAYRGLQASQNDDGGFSEARTRPRPAKSLKRRLAEATRMDKVLGRPYKPPVETVYYSGWKEMAYDLRESNLWATWSRPLALALISSRYPGEFHDASQWVFRRGPFLGWHDPARIMDIRIRSAS